MGRRKTVDDQLPREEVLRNLFIPDEVYAYTPIRIVSFDLFSFVFVNKL